MDATQDTTRLVTLPDLEELREELVPVYHKYPDNYAPQPAHLYLDEDGVITFDWGDANSVTMDVAEGRTLRFRIPAQVTGKALVAMLEDDRILCLLERIHVGHTVEWDGSNHRGRLTDDARDAADELDRLLELDYWDDSDMAIVWTTDDWMSPNIYPQTLDGDTCSWREAQRYVDIVGGDTVVMIDAQTTDEDVRAIAGTIKDNVTNEGAVLSDNPIDWLDGLRDTCRENANQSTV